MAIGKGPVFLIAVACVAAASCTGQDNDGSSVSSAEARQAPNAASAGTGQHPQTPQEPVTLAPGLVVEYVRASIQPSVDVGDRIITLVRIDPSRHQFRLLTAADHGARTAAEWSRDFGLTGVINASMYRADLRSTGLMIDGQQVNNGWNNPNFGAFFAFDPAGSDLAPVRLFGRACLDFDLERIRKEYRVVIQNYRMMDCESRPISWEDPKIYSVAAVAVDRGGWVVFIHSRTPYRMREFNTMLAESELGLSAAMFVEGGPEASLFVSTDHGKVEGIGSWETGFYDGSNLLFWRIPNVVGFSPKGRGDDG